MPLKLMYITNNPVVALIAERNGVDRVFVDMEFIGKGLRQGGMDSVQNHHTVEDVRVLRKVLTASELLVRVNPIHDELPDYPSTEDEIDAVIAAGADIVMLPYFKTVAEAERFVASVAGRARTMLLVETPEAANALAQILAVPGVDEYHIGLNDLSLGLGKKFMFQILADGTVERMCNQLRQAGAFYGFGGIAALGKGLVPAEMIIKEHYRLGSQMAILSRAFCNVQNYDNLEAIEGVFSKGVQEIRALEDECAYHMGYFTNNQKALCKAVAEVVAA